MPYCLTLKEKYGFLISNMINPECVWEYKSYGMCTVPDIWHTVLLNHSNKGGAGYDTQGLYNNSSLIIRSLIHSFIYLVYWLDLKTNRLHYINVWKYQSHLLHWAHSCSAFSIIIIIYILIHWLHLKCRLVLKHHSRSAKKIRNAVIYSSYF